MSSLFTRPQRFSRCYSISGGRCPCCAGSCRFSGTAVERTLALPQLQLFEKSLPLYVPSYLTVTRSVVAFGVQDFGLLGETPRYAVFSASWFNSGYMSTSVYVVVFLAGCGAPRAVFPCLSAFHRRQQWQCTAGFTGEGTLWFLRSCSSSTRSWRRGLMSCGVDFLGPCT